VAVASVAAIVLFGTTILPKAAGSPLPAFRDPDVLVHFDAAPGTSAQEMDRIVGKVTHELRSVPGVEDVAGHVGRAVLSDQVVDVDSGELWLSLDPNGDYDKQPSNWVRVAPLSAMFTQSVTRIQQLGATREQADALYRQLVENAKKGDANDRLYQIESTMDYDPSPLLEKIRAKLFAINFADDAVNPPELGVLEAGVARIKGARSVVVPAGPNSQGHQNASNAAVWKNDLTEFLQTV